MSSSISKAIGCYLSFEKIFRASNVYTVYVKISNPTRNTGEVVEVKVVSDISYVLYYPENYSTNTELKFFYFLAGFAYDPQTYSEFLTNLAAQGVVVYAPRPAVLSAITVDTEVLNRYNTLNNLIYSNTQIRVNFFLTSYTFTIKKENFYVGGHSKG